MDAFATTPPHGVRTLWRVYSQASTCDRTLDLRSAMQEAQPLPIYAAADLVHAASTCNDTLPSVLRTIHASRHVVEYNAAEANGTRFVWYATLMDTPSHDKARWEAAQ